MKPAINMSMSCLLLVAFAVATGELRAQKNIQKAAVAQPALVTAKTRADKSALRALEKKGRVIFEDGFESKKSLRKYFEIRGLDGGKARLDFDKKIAHSGRGAFRFRALPADGEASGSGASGWLGDRGFDRVYYRRYIRFAKDYDQGNLHHVGGGLTGVATRGKWDGMGKAGIRPEGDDRFNSSFEPWCDWGRRPPPGAMFLYTYWMDMKKDEKTGHYWGNNLQAAPRERIELARDRWICLEHMIKVNDVGKANGELAAWIGGKLYIHYTGFRWRTTEKLKIKRFSLGIYVHRSTRENVVWYDDVVLSTGYVGP
jgi:hypothetical protein